MYSNFVLVPLHVLGVIVMTIPVLYIKGQNVHYNNVVKGLCRMINWDQATSKSISWKKILSFVTGGKLPVKSMKIKLKGECLIKLGIPK